jgi:hypothetical protein
MDQALVDYEQTLARWSAGMLESKVNDKDHY